MIYLFQAKNAFRWRKVWVHLGTFIWKFADSWSVKIDYLYYAGWQCWVVDHSSVGIKVSFLFNFSSSIHIVSFTFRLKVSNSNPGLSTFDKASKNVANLKHKQADDFFFSHLSTTTTHRVITHIRLFFKKTFSHGAANARERGYRKDEC